MKKLLVVLLALTAVGMAAFADVTPLVITGSVETGAAYVAVKGGTAMWNAYDNDSGHAARTTLGIAFTTPDGNWGIISRLDAEGIVGTPGAQGNSGNLLLGADRAVLWGAVVPGMLTLKAGVLDEEAFATENEGWGNYLDGAVGLEALVTPMSGLKVGYMIPMANAAGTGDLNALTVPANHLAGNGSAADAFATSAILLSYQMPNLANVVAGFRFGTSGGANVPTQTGYLWGGFSLKAVPNLLARLELLYANLGNSTSGDATILEEVAYTMGPLVADLAMFQDFFAVSGSKVVYNFRPSVAYNLGSATVGIGLDYGTEASNNWGVVGLPGYRTATSTSDNGHTGGAAGDTVSNVGIWPYVTIPFGKNQINVGAVYAIADTGNSSTNGLSGYAVFFDFRSFF